MAIQDRRIASAARFSRGQTRPSIDRQVREGDEGLWSQFRMQVRVITKGFTNYSHPMEVFEIRLHDLWYLLIEIAKTIPVVDSSSDPLADRLANQVIIARELGHICRILPSPIDRIERELSAEEQIPRIVDATFSDGARMWSDLPFLAVDMRETWIKSVNTLTRAERESLAGFTARLAALGVCTQELTYCALVLFREALETPRRILASEKSSSTDQEGGIPLSEYLPAVLVWLRQSSFQILTLCVQASVSSNDSRADEDMLAVGSLLSSSEPNCQPGFTVTRWNFWKARCLDIQQRAGNEEVSELARKCEGMMRHWEWNIGGQEHGLHAAQEAFFNRRLVAS